MDYQQEQQELIVTKVCEIYKKISTLQDLNPSNHVNTLFTQLVTTCTTQTPIDLTNLSKDAKQTISNLIILCGKAEGLLESHYSTLIASQSRDQNPLNHIKIFPYYQNYLKLTHLEFTLLAAHLAEEIHRNVAFIGSGPLPLTSIMLATRYLRDATFHNYDIDPIANSKAIELVSKDPDLSKRMFFHTKDVFDVSGGLREYNVVFLAALVGMDKEVKGRVISHLAKYMDNGAVLLVRSAHGARGFLYPVVDPCDLKGFEVLSVFHPTDEVINSVIVARKRSVNHGFFYSQ